MTKRQKRRTADRVMAVRTEQGPCIDDVPAGREPEGPSQHDKFMHFGADTARLRARELGRQRQGNEQNDTPSRPANALKEEDFLLKFELPIQLAQGKIPLTCEFPAVLGLDREWREYLRQYC